MLSIDHRQGDASGLLIGDDDVRRLTDLHAQAQRDATEIVEQSTRTSFRSTKLARFSATRACSNA